LPPLAQRLKTVAKGPLVCVGLRGASTGNVSPTDLSRLTEVGDTAAQGNNWPRQLTLLMLDGTFAVCRLGTNAPVPAWAPGGACCSITRTADEVSVVCRQEVVPEGVVCERGWRCLRVDGTLPFTAVGVLASLTVPLADAGVGVFAVSTFNTDYLFVKETDMVAALESLRGRGHTIHYPGLSLIKPSVPQPPPRFREDGSLRNSASGAPGTRCDATFPQPSCPDKAAGCGFPHADDRRRQPCERSQSGGSTVAW
jgi:hypothetical protein